MNRNFIKQATAKTINNVEFFMNEKGMSQVEAFKKVHSTTPFGWKVWNPIKKEYDTGL